MLRIIQNRSAASAKSYYSRADYYGESQDKSGVWGGKAAEQLGLSGRVREEDFQSLCDNLDPRDGSQLTARHNSDRTVGYDFNWHVPKGVSLAYAVGGDRRIEEVFERSVNETMIEMEAEAQTRVRIGGQHANRVTGNLVWGQFLHTTSRPNDQGEVDPHLHSHCFVFNVTHDPVEDRFKAAQFRELKRDAGYFEARMHARLAKALREELGYSIVRDGKHWDIAGISKETKVKFSRRTTEIEALAREQGLTDPEQIGELGGKTRNTKTAHASFADLQTSWQNRLDASEANLFADLSAIQGSATVNGPQTAQEAVKNALSHCFEREAVVPERRVLAEALRMGVGILDVAEVQGEAQRQGLLASEIDGRRLATTPEVLADEAAVLKFARDSRDVVAPLNANWKPVDDWLSREQTDAIGQLTGSTDRLQLLLGGAGAGKTTLMQQAVAAIKQGGHDVLTFAPSAEASRKVLREEGFAQATTVAELLVNPKLQAATKNQVIWIDEASLLGSRQLKQVFDLAEKNDARVILSGDWKRQHGSVERGGVLGLLDRYTGLAPIQINTIRRQQGDYKQAIATMAEGQILAGFDQLDRLGWVHELDDAGRDQQIARDYVTAVLKGKSAMVLSPTHREAAHLTQAIRAKLREQEKIQGVEHAASTLQPRHLTEGQRRTAGFLEQGDVLVFQQNARGFRKGDHYTVDGEVPSDITEQADRFAVYRPATMPVASGDLIRITSGGRTKDGQHRLNNGSVFEVTEVTAEGDLKLRNGWVIDADFGHIAPGFVSTSHASQGRTVDHVFIAESAESLPAASREQVYVSASRGRQSAHFYTHSKAELRAAIQESSAKATASEIFWPTEQRELHRKQQRAASRELHQIGKTAELAYER